MDRLKVLAEKIIGKLMNREVITYIIFGIMTTVISIVIFNFCADKGMDEIQSNTVSTVIAVIFAFITNKIFVFESKDMSPKTVALELSKFSLGRVFTYLAETALLIVLVRFLMINQKIAKYFTQAVVIVLNYIVSKLAVFKR